MLQTTAGRLDGAICLAPDRRVASIPAPDIHAHQLAENALCKPLSNPKEHKRQCCERGNAWCAPQGHRKFIRETGKESKDYSLHIKCQLEDIQIPASSWHPQILRSSTTVACLHTLGDRKDTHALDAAAAMRNSRKLQRNISHSFGSSLCSQQCLREAKVQPGSPHPSRSLAHMHSTSACSFSPLRSLMQTAPKRFEKLPHVPASLPQVQRQMSQTNLFTGWPYGCVKNQPTQSITAISFGPKQGIWEFQNMLQETISSPPELTPLVFLFSPFAGISKQLAHSHFLLPIKCT